MGLVSIKEMMEIRDDIATLDAAITDDLYDKIDSYEIEEDEVKLLYTVTLYDENGVALVAVDVEDYDVAEEWIMDRFDIDEHDPEDADAEAAASGSLYGHA